MYKLRTFQTALVVRNLPANAGDIRDPGSVLGFGRSPGGGHGNPLQYSCLENPMNRGDWWAPQCHKASDTTEATKHSTCKTLISGFRLIEYSAKESQNISNFLILCFV